MNSTITCPGCGSDEIEARGMQRVYHSLKDDAINMGETDWDDCLYCYDCDCEFADPDQ